MGTVTLGGSGISTETTISRSHQRTHMIFLFCNYILLGAASGCIFLTLSLRLVPSACGFLLILLHGLTIAGAVSGRTAVTSEMHRWYAAHMVATVLAAIFQGSVAVLIFTSTATFLGNLKSYVREDDGAVILRLAGGLSIVIFLSEWAALTLAFLLKYYACAEGNNAHCAGNMRGSKVQQGHDELKDWPWPFQA